MKLRVGFLSIVLACSAFAQVNKSSLVGVARDSSKAAVPGVTLKITQTSTAPSVRKSPTIRIFTGHAPRRRHYTPEAEKNGFKKFVKQGIELRSAKPRPST
jgi:hypothetical protein